MGRLTHSFQVWWAQDVSYHLYVVLRSGIYSERCVETSDVVFCPAMPEPSSSRLVSQ